MDARLRRRELLLCAGAGVAGLYGCRSVTVRAGSRPRAIVVGAGLAGLSAALSLERRGWETTVLEARRRTGGRVHTLRSAFAGGQHAEAGGEYIDRNHLRVRAYARSFGLALEDVRRGFAGLEDVGFRHGRRLPLPSYATGAMRREVARYTNAIFELARAVDARDPAASARAGELDARSVADLIADLRIDGRARELLASSIRDDYGVEPEQLSLLYAAQAERLYYGVPAGAIEQFRVRGGNGRLVAALQRRITGRLVRGAAVTRIAAAGGGVAVEAGGSLFEADRCIVAAPLPALRAVAFDPRLPEPLARAIEELQYARVTKCVQQYEDRVWRERGFSGDAITDLEIGSAWEATDQQRGRRGILISYAAGELSPGLERLREPARLGLARRELDRVFPGTAPAWRAGESAAWPAERFSGGAWCSYAPGQVTAFWRALREPVGPLHFAGEHTSVFTGYMEGAIRSGERAAAEVAAIAPSRRRYSEQFSRV